MTKSRYDKGIKKLLTYNRESVSIIQVKKFYMSAFADVCNKTRMVA